MRAGFLLRQTKTGFGTFTKVFATVIKTSLRDAIIRQLQEELARQAGAALSLDRRPLKTTDNYWRALQVASGSKFHFAINDKPTP